MLPALMGDLPTSRYSYTEVVEELETLLEHMGRGGQKELAGALGFTEAQFSKRKGSGAEKFKIEHWGRMADYVGAPKGWPFVRAPQSWWREFDARRARVKT